MGKNLHTIKRELEIVIEGFQGLEALASNSDGDAFSVGRAMVPIIFQAEEALLGINLILEKELLKGLGVKRRDTGNVVGLFSLVE